MAVIVVSKPGSASGAGQRDWPDLNRQHIDDDNGLRMRLGFPIIPTFFGELLEKGLSWCSYRFFLRLGNLSEEK